MHKVKENQKLFKVSEKSVNCSYQKLKEKIQVSVMLPIFFLND